MENIKLGGCRNFLANTICSPCKGGNKLYITLTSESILLSEQKNISSQL